MGSWANPDLQMHDSIAMNAINEIAQWTSDIRHKAGKDLVVPDLLSRPFKVPKAYQMPDEDIEYLPPSATLAALEEVALNIVSPSSIADAQESCPDVKDHPKCGITTGGQVRYFQRSQLIYLSLSGGMLVGLYDHIRRTGCRTSYI